MERDATLLKSLSSVMEPNSSLRMVDVVIGLLQRDRVSEALDCIITAITFAADHDITTEEALGMLVKDINDMTPDPPQEVPYLPQLGGHDWIKVYYGPAAFRNDVE